MLHFLYWCLTVIYHFSLFADLSGAAVQIAGKTETKVVEKVIKVADEEAEARVRVCTGFIIHLMYGGTSMHQYLCWLSKFITTFVYLLGYMYCSFENICIYVYFNV